MWRKTLFSSTHKTQWCIAESVAYILYMSPGILIINIIIIITIDTYFIFYIWLYSAAGSFFLWTFVSWISLHKSQQHTVQRLCTTFAQSKSNVLCTSGLSVFAPHRNEQLFIRAKHKERRENRILCLCVWWEKHRERLCVWDRERQSERKKEMRILKGKRTKKKCDGLFQSHCALCKCTPMDLWTTSVCAYVCCVCVCSRLSASFIFFILCSRDFLSFRCFRCYCFIPRTGCLLDFYPFSRSSQCRKR